MKFISLQENLKRGLNIVGHATAKNVNLPILNNILIRAEGGNIELISTNLEIGVRHQLRGKIEIDGEFTVDSKLITEYSNLLNPGEKVKIEEKDGELKIESGNYKTRIKGESAKEFPLIPTLESEEVFSCSLIDLKKSLSSVVFAVSNSENRAELTGVFFSFFENNLTLAATDSYRLAERKLVLKSGSTKNEQKIIVPAKTIQELLRILTNLDGPQEMEEEDLVFISFSENQVLFKFDSVSLISRLINGRYPDYQQIIPSKSQTEVVAEKNELIRAIKAVSLFSKTGINDITLLFLKGKISISAFSGASGESQAEVAGEINGQENEITINYRYLLDGLNNIEGGQVIIKILNNTTPCLIKAMEKENYLYIVMPIKQ